MLIHVNETQQPSRNVTTYSVGLQVQFTDVDVYRR